MLHKKSIIQYEYMVFLVYMLNCLIRIPQVINLKRTTGYIDK